MADPTCDVEVKTLALVTLLKLLSDQVLVHLLYEKIISQNEIPIYLFFFFFLVLKCLFPFCFMSYLLISIFQLFFFYLQGEFHFFIHLHLFLHSPLVHIEQTNTQPFAFPLSLTLIILNLFCAPRGSVLQLASSALVALLPLVWPVPYDKYLYHCTQTTCFWHSSPSGSLCQSLISW